MCAGTINPFSASPDGVVWFGNALGYIEVGT